MIIGFYKLFPIEYQGEQSKFGFQENLEEAFSLPVVQVFY